MTGASDPATSAWSDATLAASLFAVDPPGTGGIVLRALPGPVRDRWLAILHERLPENAPVRRVPLHASEGRLLGGLDLSATLEAGRPVAERGLLAEADGGVVEIAMAERVSAATAAQMGHALDRGEVTLEREGFARRLPARFGVVALDEGIDADEGTPTCLVDRLAFAVDLSPVGAREAAAVAPSCAAIAAARARLPRVAARAECIEALGVTAARLGIVSLRVPLLALKVARAAAALARRDEVAQEDCATASRLVFAPRVRAALPEPETAPAEPEPESTGERDRPDVEETGEGGSLADRLAEAARAVLPDDALERLQLAGPTSRQRSAGKAGARQHSTLRGRPAGVRSGTPAANARLDLIETLRAAAPWQRLRRAERGVETSAHPGRVLVRREDFRVTRYRRRSETTTIFAVDASGSTALHRLAEAKGAVELLLAQCYVRRDRVALVAFRGSGADLLLPPTRSLVRAKRSLAALPGGGATPLCSGIESALGLADAVQRRGGTPLLVLLTDGHANVAGDGQVGRVRGEEDATRAARLVAASNLGALLVDTSPRPQRRARDLARAMNARYLPLPHADAHALGRAAREAAASTARVA